MMAVDESVLADNALLASLPHPARTELAGRLALREFGLKELVYRQGGEIASVVLPVRGVFSLISFLADGRGAEVATVGNEGVVGLPVFLRPDLPAAHRAIAQIPGGALFMPASEFLEIALPDGPLRVALCGYAQGLITQIAQGSVCNRLHSMEQRCIRWLLQTHDRVRVDRFPLTQEFLGLMLGARRQSVNLTARKLQDAGLIRYVRGTMTIVDRPALDAAACECYHVVRKQFERLYR